MLDTCFDEVHVLYPFLHPPSVRQTHECLWKDSLSSATGELEENQELRFSAAIVFICLALGRCTASSRIDKEDGAHSAGWSLYSVALDLARPLLDIASGPAIALTSLQVLTWMVSSRGADVSAVRS